MAQVWLKYASSMAQVQNIMAQVASATPFAMVSTFVCVHLRSPQLPSYVCGYVCICGQAHFFRSRNFSRRPPPFLFGRVTSVFTSIFDHFNKCRYNHTCFHGNGRWTWAFLSPDFGSEDPDLGTPTSRFTGRNIGT